MPDRACPCLYTKPCQESCSCVKPMMSHGCTRCASYGSLDQRRSMASILAAQIDGTAAIELLTQMREMAAQACENANEVGLARVIRALPFPVKEFDNPYDPKNFDTTRRTP
jgi:hypothetical protein